MTAHPATGGWPVPAPGTRLDLLADAAALGLTLTDRVLDEHHRHGLLASPQRRSLGKGHGQAPAVYSAQQRAVYRRVLHALAAGASPRVAASIPVHVWLHLPAGWVALEQVQRAARYAVGNPQKSKPDAERAARLLLDQVDLDAADIRARKRLREVLVDALQRGRVDTVPLDAALDAVMGSGGALVSRGPQAAPLNALAVSAVLTAKLRGMRLVASRAAPSPAVNARWESALHWHRDAQAGYAAMLTTLPAGELHPRVAALYRPAALDSPAEKSLPTLLLLLGLTA